MPESYFDQRALQRFQRNLRKIDVRTSSEMMEGLELAANEVVKAARADHPKATSRAEASLHPYPRFYTWTGLTVAGIAANEPRRTRDGIEVEVISSEGHSAALEFGTSQARAFPFLGPALETVGDKAFQILARAAEKAIK